MRSDYGQVNGRTIGIWYIVTIGAGIFAQSMRSGLMAQQSPLPASPIQEHA